MLMLKASSKVNVFANCHLPIQRAICRVFGPSLQRHKDQWHCNYVAVGQWQPFPTLQRMFSVKRVFQHQDSSVSDATLPEMPASSEVQTREGVLEKKWQERYVELKAYYDEHGNTNVPMTFDKTLGAWVRNQRFYFKEGRLGVDRVQKLQELQFSFDNYETSWMESYEQLKAYKAEYGNTLVPFRWPPNEPLGFWVDTQRNMSVIKSQSMVEERTALLDAVGFEWSAREAKWMMKFEELKNHKRINGTGYPSAASLMWVHYQRKQYRQYLEGKKVALTAERLEKLRSLGIDF